MSEWLDIASARPIEFVDIVLLARADGRWTVLTPIGVAVRAQLNQDAGR